jgi:hypothetical protein
MWEQLFREMNQAAFNTDMRLYERMMANAGVSDREGFDYIGRQTDRFVITSVDRGSLLVGGAIFLAAVGGLALQGVFKAWLGKIGIKEKLG